AALNAIDGVTCQIPRGAFYVFPNIAGLCARLGVIDAYNALPEAIRQRTSPSTLFQMFLLFEHKVATLDRKSFGRFGSSGKHFLRISIATSLDDLEAAVLRIAAAASDRAGFRKFMAAGRHLSLTGNGFRTSAHAARPYRSTSKGRTRRSMRRTGRYAR